MKSSMPGLAALTLVVAMAGCGDDPSDPPGGTAWVRGRVVGGSGYIGRPAGPFLVLGDAVMRLMSVASSGSLVDVTTGSVISDVRGNYVVATDRAAGRWLIVEAIGDTVTWRGIIGSSVAAGDTVAAPPLNDETTLEAALWAEVHTIGQAWLVTPPRIAPWINSGLAGPARAVPAAVPVLAAALVEEATAASLYLQAEGITPNLLSLYDRARAENLADLDENLDVLSRRDLAPDAACADWRAADILAANGALISTDLRARQIEVSARALRRAVGSLRSDLLLETVRTSAIVRARATAAAVEELAAGLSGGPAPPDFALALGTLLDPGLADAGSEAAIRTAVTAWRADVVMATKTMRPDLAARVDGAVAALTAPGGARDQLVGALNDAGAASDVVTAYRSFFATVDQTLAAAGAGAPAEWAEVAAILRLALMSV